MLKFYQFLGMLVIVKKLWLSLNHHTKAVYFPVIRHQQAVA